MKTTKKALMLCLLVVMMFLAIHTLVSEDSARSHDSEVLIRHDCDNQSIVHNKSQDHAIVDKLLVILVTQASPAAENVRHFFYGRTRQREGALFKQRARSTIQSVLCH